MSGLSLLFAAAAAAAAAAAKSRATDQELATIHIQFSECNTDFPFKRNVQITSYLLLALVVTQIIYTALFTAKIAGPRPLLWGLEGVLFTFLAAFAGAALVQAKNYHLGWAAIAFSAILNVVQVSIGLKLFGPFGGAAQELEALGPLIGAVVALSFMIYNTAKILLKALLYLRSDPLDVVGDKSHSIQF